MKAGDNDDDSNKTGNQKRGSLQRSGNNLNRHSDKKPAKWNLTL